MGACLISHYLNLPSDDNEEINAGVSKNVYVNKLLATSDRGT